MNRITSLFGIQYPIIQGGMVWCSGWRLASAVSNAGGLGLLGAGSMHPETLREHIRKCRAATDRPFGVNIPLMYPQIEEIMAIVAEEGVKIVFTSAGNPKAWTGWLHERGIILFNFGTGPIRGFATTLIICILCSFFTAVFLTRLVYEHYMGKDKWLNLTFTTGISKNLKHHARVVCRTAFRRIPAVKFFKVYLFNDTVNNPDRIVLGNKIA